MIIANCAAEAKMTDSDDTADPTTYEYDDMELGAAELSGSQVRSVPQSGIHDDSDGDVAIRALFLDRNK
jgi:hypothetical protein